MERSHSKSRKIPVEADDIGLGERVKFGSNVRIRGKSVFIGDDCTFEDGTDIFVPDGFTIGACSYFGPQTRIKCWRFHAGSYLFFEREVEVGQGGCISGPNSTVDIGDAVFCGVRVIINPSHRVSIGNETGIGAHVGIWTHGAWNSMAEGYPVSFAPVSIGRNVWLAGRSQVLPGVQIGDGAVIGMMSLVNKSLPECCLAGGVPVRILQEDKYPIETDLVELARSLAQEYNEQVAAWKGIASRATSSSDTITIEGARFHLGAMVARGELSDVAEDFRDFIRRKGIRFLTGKPFKSIPHPEVERWS